MSASQWQHKNPPIPPSIGSAPHLSAMPHDPLLELVRPMTQQACTATLRVFSREGCGSEFGEDWQMSVFTALLSRHTSCGGAT